MSAFQTILGHLHGFLVDDKVNSLPSKVSSDVNLGLPHTIQVVTKKKILILYQQLSEVVE